jgi:hypothetical protein
MSLGAMQCIGTTQFLKTRYGAGYKLIFDRKKGMTLDHIAALTNFVCASIPEAKYVEEDGADAQVLYSLPFHTISRFGPFFGQLEKRMDKLYVTSYGVTITSLEDVFLKVGEDHTVTPQDSNIQSYGIGQDCKYEANFTSQVIGLASRKLSYSLNDFITIPLLALPIAVGIAAAILYQLQIITENREWNDLVVSAMYAGAYLGAPGLIAEFIVRERSDKLRNVLTVMGCDFRAYWLGTFIADYFLLSIVTSIIYITWPSADMIDFYSGLSWLVLLVFNLQLIAFAYFFSFIFTSPKSCIALMPVVILVLVLTPSIVLLIMIKILGACGTSLSSQVQGGILLWGIMLLSPHGALLAALLDCTGNFSSFLSNFPPVGATLAFMLAESAAFLAFVYYTDAEAISKLLPGIDPSFNPDCLYTLDEDVKLERERTLASDRSEPLRIESLRKVFLPKRQGQHATVAAEDICFKVESGEIFGLLGANGAGKVSRCCCCFPVMHA